MQRDERRARNYQKNAADAARRRRRRRHRRRRRLLLLINSARLSPATTMIADAQRSHARALVRSHYVAMEATVATAAAAAAASVVSS